MHIVPDHLQLLSVVAGRLAVWVAGSTWLRHSACFKRPDWHPVADNTPDGEDVDDRSAPRPSDLGSRRDHGGLVWGGHLCVLGVHDAMASTLPQENSQGEVKPP